jgi:hypothetical protein
LKSANRHESTDLEDLARAGATAAVIEVQIGRRVKRCRECGSFYRKTCIACAAREWRAAHPRVRPEPRRYETHLYSEDGQVGVEIEDLADGAVDPLASKLSAKMAARALILRVPVPVDEEAETAEEEERRRRGMRDESSVRP